jgi:uncharacterized repeat protein (TIGR02543 family)
MQQQATFVGWNFESVWGISPAVNGGYPFFPKQLTITLNTNGSGTTSGAGTFLEGTSRTVTATPNAGNLFVNWTKNGQVVSTNASYTFTLTEDTTLTTNFAQAHTVSFNSHGGSAVSSAQVIQGQTFSAPTAPTRTGFTFAGWFREASYTTPWNFASDTVTQNVTLHARWDVITYTVTYNAGPGGSITGTSPQTVNHGANSTNVTAVANTGYTFANWSDGNSNATRNHTNVTSNITITANFQINQYNLAVTSSEGGSFTHNGLGNRNHGSIVNLQANANEHYEFVNWTRGEEIVSTNAVYTFTLTEPTTLRANFRALVHVTPPEVDGVQIVSNQLARFRIRHTAAEQIQINNTTVNRDGNITVVDVPIAGTGNQTFTIKAHLSGFESEPVTRTINITDYTTTLRVDAASIAIADFETARTRVTWDAVPGADRYVVFVDNNLIGDPVSSPATMNRLTYGEKVIRIHVMKDGIIGQGTVVTLNYMDTTRTYNNLRVTRAVHGTYVVEWEGTSTGRVELKQGQVVIHTADGRFNRAVFQSLADGVYGIYINGRFIQSFNTANMLSSSELPAGTYSNIQLTRAAGAYVITWEGTSTGRVELRQGQEARYTADGRFNRVVFLRLDPGTYDLVISRNQVGPIVIEGEAPAPPPSEPQQVTISNVVLTRAVHGTYTITWEGPATATVRLLQGEEVKYTASGRLNRAVFSTILPGEYNVSIAGIDGGTVTFHGMVQEPTAPSAPTLPSNIATEVINGNTLVVTWEGPSSAKVFLLQNNTVILEGNGRFNRVSFLSLANGQYNTRVGAVSGPTATINHTASTNPSSQPPAPSARNVSLTKTVHGTYALTWEGNPTQGRVELRQNNTTRYSASGRFNRATFSEVVNGEYRVYLAGVSIGTATVHGSVSAPSSGGTSANYTNLKIENTSFVNRYRLTWGGGASNASLVVKQGETKVVNLSSTRFRAVTVTLLPGIYEVYIGGQRIGFIGTHKAFTAQDGTLIGVHPETYEIVNLEVFEIVDGERVYELYEGSIQGIVPAQLQENPQW